MAFVGISLKSLVQKQAEAERPAQPQAQNITVNVGPEIAAAIREAINQPSSGQTETAPVPQADDDVKAKLALISEEIKAAKTQQQAPKARTAGAASTARAQGMRIITPPPEPTE